LNTLTEEDVESFLFPEGLPWKELRPDMMNNPPFFLSQNLCIFPKDEDAELKVQFDEDELRAHLKPPSFFGTPIISQTVMAIDRAFSISQFADFSCIAIAKLQIVQGRNACVIADVRMEKWRESELVKAIVEMIERHRPSTVIAEKDRNWEDLWAAVRK